LFEQLAQHHLKTLGISSDQYITEKRMKQLYVESFSERIRIGRNPNDMEDD
jgi:predicted CopG family antitoxin